MIPKIKLSNNLEIPQIGLGLWQINDKDVMTQVLANAIELGYSMFDTAAVYGNELAVKKALSLIPPPHTRKMLKINN